MEKEQEIVIPEAFIELLLKTAAELNCSVEELVEKAIRDYLEKRGENDGE